MGQKEDRYKYWSSVENHRAISSHSLMFFKTGVLNNFANCTSNQLPLSLFNKVAALQVTSCNSTYFISFSSVPIFDFEQVHVSWKVNFEHISYLFVSASIVDYEQVNVSWADMSFS